MITAASYLSVALASCRHIDCSSGVRSSSDDPADGANPALGGVLYTVGALVTCCRFPSFLTLFVLRVRRRMRGFGWIGSAGGDSLMTTMFW